jgi:hypothetical protein
LTRGLLHVPSEYVFELHVYLYLRIYLYLPFSLPDVVLDPFAVPLRDDHARHRLHLGHVRAGRAHLQALRVDDQETPLEFADLLSDGSRDGLYGPKRERELPESLICDGNRAEQVERGAKAVVLGGPEGRETTPLIWKGREGEQEVQLLVCLEAELTQVEGACGKSCCFLTHREFALS